MVSSMHVQMMSCSCMQRFISKASMIRNSFSFALKTCISCKWISITSSSLWRGSFTMNSINFGTNLSKSWKSRPQPSTSKNENSTNESALFKEMKSWSPTSKVWPTGVKSTVHRTISSRFWTLKMESTSGTYLTSSKIRATRRIWLCMRNITLT